MKKILQVFIFIVITATAKAQIPLLGNITTNGATQYPTHLDSLGYGGFRVVKDVAERNAITTLRRKLGMAVYVQSEDVIYILKDPALGNANWASLLGAGTGLMYYSDSAAMLSHYVRNHLAVKYTDTATMLGNLLKLSDTSSMFSGYGRSGQLVKYSDTVSMMSNQLRISDTSQMFSGYARGGQIVKYDDTTAMLGNRLKISDTSAMLAGYEKAGSDVYSNNITVYARNGFGKYAQGQTIPAIGKTTKEILMDALTEEIAPTYTQPTISVSGSPSADTFEIGSSLNITLSSNFTQNDAGSQTSVSYAKGGSALGGNTDNIASLTSAVSYTATVLYGQGPVKNNNLGTPDPTGRIAAGSKTSSSITYRPQAKRYWGYSSTNTPSDADILAVAGGGAELSGSKSKGSFNITVSGGNPYIFYAYPSSLGNLTSISVGGFESLGTFTHTTRSVTNAQGYTQNYLIYVSTNSVGANVNNIIIN